VYERLNQFIIWYYKRYKEWKYYDSSGLLDVENGPLVYYLADDGDNKVFAKDCYLLDIRSAYPTLVNFLYEKDIEKREFLKTLNSIKDKLAKNIYISTNLSSEELKMLGRLAKFVIVSFVLEIAREFDTDIKILELKKDGVLIKTDDQNVLILLDQLIGDDWYTKFNNFYTEFLRFVGIRIKVEKIARYLRVDKTSYYLNGTFDIKGLRKTAPSYLAEVRERIVNDENIEVLYQDLQKYYNKKTAMLLEFLNKRDEISRYYLINNTTILSPYKATPIKYTPGMLSKHEFTPWFYITTFISPVIYLVRTK